MQFIDLHAQYQELEADIQERMQKVFMHSRYILGPEVFELEEQLADFVGVKHCITVANGSDALLIAMMALGVGSGDEVITSAFSFIAPGEMVQLLGASPVFVDIDPKTYNIEPARIAEAITQRTKAIIPVDLFGQCADYDDIVAVAAKHGLPIVADAAQSLGATYKGKRVGSLSTITCTSFFPSKPLGCYGDGGACFTDDDALADKMRCIRHHGEETRYNHRLLGLNSRLDTLQAAVLLAKLSIFPRELERRTKVAEMYAAALPEQLQLPFIEPSNTSAFAQYTVQVTEREKVRAFLEEQGIPSAVHYPLPCSKQPVFNEVPSKHALPRAEQVAKRVMSLPFHPYIEGDQVAMIANAMSEAMGL